MTITNTQTTELSLDQLDDISAGWAGILRGASILSKKVGRNIALMAPDLAEEAGIPVYAIGSIGQGPWGWIHLAEFTHRGGWQESARKTQNTASRAVNLSRNAANKARNLFGRVFG